MQYIGEEIRRAKKIGRQELADACGIPYRTIDNWENGRREPRIGQLKKVAVALGVTIDDLFVWDEEEESTSEKKDC